MSTSTVSIGEAARSLGTTPRTLRHYECVGLLTPAGLSSGGHRRYDAVAVSRARRILALRALGLPLNDIGSVLDGSDSGRLAAVLRDQATRLTAEVAQRNALLERVTTALSAGESPGSDAPHVAPLDLLEDLAMTIRLTRIYTRTGDDGTTGLPGDIRVEKSDPRLDVGGDLDELVSAIGLAIAAPGAVRGALLRQIQNDLFDLGAVAAAEPGSSCVTAEYTTRLEAVCDELNAPLPPLGSFVLPGGSAYTAALHLARSVCRRAERHAWGVEGMDREVCRYLNRLSDLLFVLARSAEPVPEATWVPGAPATG